MKKSVKYLTNKNFMHEIHESKITFCHLLSDNLTHNYYDGIVDAFEDITSEETIYAAKEAKSKRIASDNYDKACAGLGKKDKKPKLAEFYIDPETINTDDLVIRLMTFDHIPVDLTRKKTHKTVADRHAKVNFPPFKHFILEDGTPKVVLISHTDSDGEFSVTCGHLTNKLAQMFMLLAERYSMKGNWRAYSYVDEMRSTGLLQLAAMPLHFNEFKSSNPFAYYSKLLSNSFIRVANAEKQIQNTRDDLLIAAGKDPSITRQVEIDEQIRRAKDSRG